MHLERIIDDAVAAGRLNIAHRDSIQATPLVVDSYGHWGESARRILHKCAEQFPPASRSAKLQGWRASRSVALQRETSRLLRARALGAHLMGEEHPPDVHAPSTYLGGWEVL